MRSGLELRPNSYPNDRIRRIRDRQLAFAFALPDYDWSFANTTFLWG